MRKFTALFAAAATVAVCLSAAPADAQLNRTWVSGNGSDGNDCSRPTPCQTLTGALARTNAGGEINCVDSLSFNAGGTVTITTSITIDCTGHFASMGTAGFVLQAGSSPVVVLRGLSFEGSPSGQIGIDAAYNGPASVSIENCLFSNFQGPATGKAIRVRPNSAVLTLSISNTIIENNGLAGSGGGIFIEPSGSGSVRGVIENTRVLKNTLGMVVDGTGSTGHSVIEINNSLVANSALNGITVNQAGVLINRTSVEGNGGNGILAGPGAVVHLGSSTVATNALGGLAYNGGQILSYQDNKIMGNGVDNNPSGVLALK